MNPLKAALDSKIGQYLQGRNVVDNEANPNSALNRRKRSVELNSRRDPSAANDAIRRGIEKAYGASSTVKRFGTPK